jgi:ABC-type branched-subunit amino acid transport system permease subunit
MTLRKFDATIVFLLLSALAISIGAWWIPGWIRFISQMAISAGLASLGAMVLLRAGLLSFGQGLFYFAGAYTAALSYKYLGLNDAALLIVFGIATAGIIAASIGFFIANYRGIFFAMLTLAISMLVYGIAVKVTLFGGSDGLNIGLISILGFRFRGPDLQVATFLICVWTAVFMGTIAHLFLRSRLGKVIEAIEDNEVRLEYLGKSVRNSVHVAYTLAGALGGAGGVLAALSARHVDPGFAYWTTAGDFVFIVILSGQASVLSPFFGAFALELLRTFAAANFPDTWQMVLGTIMLLIVLFVPKGLGHLFIASGLRWKARRRAVVPTSINGGTARS